MAEDYAAKCVEAAEVTRTHVVHLYTEMSKHQVSYLVQSNLMRHLSVLPRSLLGIFLHASVPNGMYILL